MAMNFNKTVLAEFKNNMGPSPLNTFFCVCDVDADGRQDVVVSARDGKMAWFKNNGKSQWTINEIDDVTMMECGGCAFDITGNGYPDIICGGDYRSSCIYWWENPGSAKGKWKKRLIADTGFTQFHDVITGSFTGNGRPELIFTNQHGPKGTNIYLVPIPKDYVITPWPGLEIIAEGKNGENPFTPSGRQPEEGLAAADIDNDGMTEIICGTRWYKFMGDRWACYRFARDYISTKVAVCDIDNDGQKEILLSEGDPCIYGKTCGGKLSYFKPGKNIYAMWEEHIITDWLFDAHSLQTGNITGNGRQDILCGEIGMTDKERNYIVRPPKIFIYENNGNGTFTRHDIDEGTGIHDAVLTDINGDGFLEILGKPLHGDEMWKIHQYSRF